MKPYRVLVVEDEAIVSMDIQERLSRMGYELAGTAATGQRAVDLTAAQQPDLILMDIRLQGEMDGIAAAQLIHQQSRTPVIFLTAYSEDATLERAKLAEPFGYILKPFDDRELKSSIEIALYKHAAEEEIRRLNRLYDVLSGVNQTTVLRASREELLPEICRLVVKRGQIDLAWIGWLDDATGRIHPIASCGLTSESLTEIEFENLDHQTSRSSFGSVLRDGEAFIVNECGPACCLAPAAQSADPLPFQSCASFPLRFQGRVCGALNLCTVAPGFFRQHEIELLHEVASDLSFALDKIEGDSQRRKAELALAESQARLELALEAAQMGVFEWDVAADALYWSPRCLEIYGVSEGAHGLDSFRALLHPEDADWVMEVLNHCLQDRTVLDIEFRITRPDGTVRWIANLAKTTYDAQGHPQRMVGTVQDTTARWQAAEQLRKSEARLLLAAEAAQLGVWERDLKTGQLYWSAVQEQLMGYEPGTFPGTDEAYRELIHPGSVNAHAEAQKRVRGDTGVFHEELHFRLRDGRERWGLLRGQMLCDERGEPERIVGVQLDITERRQAEFASIEQRNLGLALSATDDMGEAVQLCLDAAMRVADMDAGVIYLVNEQTGGLDLVAHHGLSAAFVQSVAHYAASGPQASKVREGNTLHLRYADLDLPKSDAEMTEGLRAVTVLPIMHEGRVVAVLNVASHKVDVLPPVTRHTLESVATQIGAVIARLRVEKSLRKSERRLRALSRRLESMREEERTRISREIHDELGQMLTGIRMDLGSIEHDLDAFQGDPRVSSMVERLVAATELTEMTIRTVQRIAAELRPGILDKLGLEMALQYEVDQFRRRTGLGCRLLLPENSQTMDAKVATVFFRICQEALTNVARHARATAVEVALRTGGEWLELTVGDNGHGMADADRSDFKSLGLLGMQERARQIGGSVTFTSPPDGGTLVALRVPNILSPAEQP